MERALQCSDSPLFVLLKGSYDVQGETHKLEGLCKGCSLAKGHDTPPTMLRVNGEKRSEEITALHIISEGPRITTVIEGWHIADRVVKALNACTGPEEGVGCAAIKALEESGGI